MNEKNIIFTLYNFTIYNWNYNSFLIFHAISAGVSWRGSFSVTVLIIESGLSYLGSKAVCISHNTNNLWKGMTPTILPLVKGK